MNRPLSAGALALPASALFTLALAVSALQAADLPAVAKPNVGAPVTITDNGSTWTMDNGLVKMTVIKNNSNLQALVFHGVPIVSRSNYWERTPSGQVTPSVTIDPAKTAGNAARSP